MQSKLFFSIVLTLLLAPVLAVWAQPAPPIAGVPDTGVPTTILGFYNFVCIASNWLFAFVMIIAVIFLLLGAVKFFSAGGDEAAVGKARQYIAYALVGIAVAILARSFVFVVGNFVGAPGGGFFGC